MGIGLNPLQVTIGAGASLSPEVDLGQYILCGIQVPAGWTAAGITAQVSSDGGNTWNEAYYASGSELLINAAASQYMILNPSDWLGINAVKFRSGTLATPVNQTTASTLTLVTRLLF